MAAPQVTKLSISARFLSSLRISCEKSSETFGDLYLLYCSDLGRKVRFLRDFRPICGNKYVEFGFSLRKYFKRIDWFIESMPRGVLE